MKAVRYTRAALKSLAAIPSRDAMAIRDKVNQYAADPASLANNVKKLQDRTEFRLRVGTYRVIFNEDRVVVEVLQVGRREGIYR